LIVPPCVETDSDWPSKMLEYDCRIRECFCKVRQFGDLRMVDPTFERQPIIFQVRMGSTEIGITKKVLHDGRPVRRTRRSASCRQNTWLRPGSAVTDTTKPLPAGRQMSFEYRGGAVAQPHIHCADDAGGGAKIAVTSAGTLGGKDLNKLLISDNLNFF